MTSVTMGPRLSFAGGALALRKFLTRHQATAWQSQIEQALADKRDVWGIHGWGYVGKHPRIRVAVRVDQRLVAPDNPATTLRWRDDTGRVVTIKVAIEASHDRTEHSP
ncbi:MAG: hypothetical protein ACPG4T_05340 [Nannocystaceae bacterium]